MWVLVVVVSLFFFFFFFFFFFNDTATTEIYTLSLHDALPIRCSPICGKCTANRGSISIRMPGSNVHEIGLRWGNEHEGIAGKLSKKNGKSCTNTAIGPTAGGPQTRERNLKSPGAALPPAPGPGAVEFRSRNSAAPLPSGTNQ